MNWKSVKDGLPPTMEHIIVWDGLEVHDRLFSRGWGGLSIKEFISRTKVTHWMPLPAPPTKTPSSETDYIQLAKAHAGQPENTNK